MIDTVDTKVRGHCHVKKKMMMVQIIENLNNGLVISTLKLVNNLRGYDSHLILGELSKFSNRFSIPNRLEFLDLFSIPNRLEKYMSFTLGNNIVFIGSMLFMNSSLDKLVKNLGSKDFKYLSEEFSAEKLELVKQKGIYIYEYFSSFKKFKKDRLLDIDFLFSSLKNSGISEEEYQRACDVWKVFGFKTLGQYLKTDVLLLCDVFEKCISVCLKDYGLDPCHYFSSPSLSWDSMLLMTGIQLENINNIDVHLFLEKGMRGAVSYISRRYSKSDENTEIMYWNMSNLYGTLMSFDYLLYGGFKLLSEEEIRVFDMGLISENSLVGYILEVDLEYCWELRDLHNDYPLCPEKIEVSKDMLSSYCRGIADRCGIKVGGVKK